jgi:CheY-like chemotaxis protein
MEPQPPPSSLRRILVVDDNRDAADSLAELLRLAGFEVATAYDGAEAVSRARTFAPDAAILDLNMPVLDGFGVADALGDSGSPTVLVAHSSDTRPETLARAARTGFSWHFAKPTETERLLEFLRKPGAAATWSLDGQSSPKSSDECRVAIAPSLPLAGWRRASIGAAPLDVPARTASATSLAFPPAGRLLLTELLLQALALRSDAKEGRVLKALAGWVSQHGTKDEPAAKELLHRAQHLVTVPAHVSRVKCFSAAEAFRTLKQLQGQGWCIREYGHCCSPNR